VYQIALQNNIERWNMLIGYARTSTVEQQAGFDAQIVELKKTGCERIFEEQVSSVAVRAELDAAIDFAREGDTFVVTKLDRLARSVAHLVEIAARLQNKKVALRILGMGIDTSTATGRMMLNIVGAIAQFEREVMLERQREGIAKAKTEGRYRGRKPTAIAKAGKVRQLKEDGVRPVEIARQLGISRASVYRCLEL
jgi:DNA invertase Pin-like site-specific DNA recombinase